MTTIFTDDFAYADLDITLASHRLGYKGRELVLTTDDNREFRVVLSDKQLTLLADALEMNGYSGDKE